MTTKTLQEKRRNVTQELLEAVDRRDGLILVKAPPGSGKTYITLRGMALAYHRGFRVAVAAQTNNQADDICRRFAEAFPSMKIYRFAASGQERPEGLSAVIHWIQESSELPEGPCIVVATSAKWTAINRFDSFDWLFIDEAWQLSWAHFMLLGAIAPRFVLVGDPGQIEPTIRVDVSRWQTSHRKPHLAAPEVILSEPEIFATVLELPVSTRLPHDTVELVRPFYDFHFDGWSQPGDRQLFLEPCSNDHSHDGVCEMLTSGSVVLMQCPSPEYGCSVEDDGDLAESVAELVQRLLERKASYQMEGMAEPKHLAPSDIGVAATHRLMVTRLSEALGDLAHCVRCDTVERWQGLERKLMVVVHPLSGQLYPSSFDLNTGRLNVMLSRHQIGVVVVTRDHVGKTLADYAPRADQAIGVSDEAGRGHSRNLALWHHLEHNNRSILIGG